MIVCDITLRYFTTDKPIPIYNIFNYNRILERILLYSLKYEKKNDAEKVYS